MERFDIRGSHWGLMEREDGLGAFCWAERGLWYRRQYHMTLAVTVVLIVVCAVLAGYLVYHKPDPQVIHSGVTEEHYQQLTQTLAQLRDEKAVDRKKITDLMALNKNLSVQIKTRNYVLAQYENKLKALAVAVPPQPVILEAVRNEAATPAGFRQVVARSFGDSIDVSHIKIIGE